MRRLPALFVARPPLLLYVAAGVTASAFACAPRGEVPAPGPALALVAQDPALETSIEAQPICIGSSVASAGTVADTLYYRAARLPDGKVAVGYFVFFTEERPWGNNWLTWTLFPALGVDLVYSRSLFVAPGLQRILFGKGDVEGFRIVYDLESGDALRIDSAVADDGHEKIVELDRDEVLALDPHRPTLYADAWSHQLGGRGARSTADLVYLRCYDRRHIRPLSDEVAHDYRVEKRADPAHVELLGGKLLLASRAEALPATSD